MQKSLCCPTLRGEIKKARAGNYETSSCLFEFLDNSMDAGADCIRIDIRERSGTGLPHKFILSDNAPQGIPLDALKTIFSWTYERQRSATDVGEYGTGFKTAAVNLAEKLVVLTKHGEEAFQATADWQDMADEDRWDPHVMVVSLEHFHDRHPFRHGSSFVLEGLRNEMFVSTSCTTKLVSHLFRKIFDEVAYHYRYVLHENPNLRITLKGVPEEGHEISEVDIREHSLFRQNTDPFGHDPLLLETALSVYQDAQQFYRVFHQNYRTKKWEGVEFVEKRKNGNSVLKVYEVAPSTMESMRLIDHLSFRSVHLRGDHSTACMALYPTCTMDIVRRGRVMGRDLSLRAPRAEALSFFVKHEVWYHSYTINALLGVQYNKQNHGVLRENALRYTLEHLQQVHEREFFKAEKAVVVVAPPPPMAPLASQPVAEKETSTTPHEAILVEVPPAVQEKRKNFTPLTKMEILYRQECRDSLLDFVLKDNVLMMEYDHINGKASMNTKDNCQALSVITHALKSRKPDIFDNLQHHPLSKTEFIVDLLNCITRSKYFMEAWISGNIQVRDPQQQVAAVQEGLFSIFF